MKANTNTIHDESPSRSFESGAEHSLPELTILAPDGRWVPLEAVFGACTAPAIPDASVRELIAEAKRRRLTMESVLRAVRKSWD